MGVSVYTYHHPQKWHEQKDLYDSIKNEIHITATKNMADGIKDYYRQDEKGEFQYIFTIRQVMNRIFHVWSSPEIQLKQFLSLANVISKESTTQELKDSFRSNTAELLETIRSLVITGLKPQDFTFRNKKLTAKEDFFKQVWAGLEEDDSSYRDFRDILGRRWKREKIIKSLNRLLKTQFEDGLEKNLLQMELTHTKLVLHGFYFITPEQQVFLKKLQEAGFEIIFMNFYDDRFPNTFDFTKAFISQRFDWTDEWNIYPNKEDSITLGTALLSAFEEGKTDNLTKPGQITAYDTFDDFLHEKIIKHYPIGEKTTTSEKEFQFIATNADILNEILVQYYPENFADNRNFLNYPVGRFILKIHEMLQEGQLVLNEEILMGTFSSGWLYDEVEKKNARDYTHELKQLLPFFVGCDTTKDWLDRFKELIDQYEQILPLFEGKEDNRVVESIRSPFTKISYLSLDQSVVKQIRCFVLLLTDMATNLFVLSTDSVSMKEHFVRLTDLMNKHNPINHTILKEEEERLINKLTNKLSQIEDDHLFLYENIGQAISFYLSGKFSENEDTFIKPFIEVDGEAFKRNTKQVYLTGLDEQGLPLSEFSTPWPLQDETYALLSESHRVLELNELRNRSIKQISRYLLFIALDLLPNEKLELSWIRHFLDRANLQPAVYVHQLDLQVVPHSFMSKAGEKTQDKRVEFTTFLPNEDELQSAFDELKYEDILAEYELCQRRFYYGYVLDRYPVFSDEFIHQFLFSEIVKLVKRYTQQDNDEVIEMVSELFPQWTNFKKNTIAQTSIGFAGHWQEKQDVIMENVSVSETRKNFQFPGLKKDDRQELFNRVMEKKESIMNSLKNPTPEMAASLEANPGYNCRYCPHLDSCSEAVFAVDEGKK